MRTIKRKALRLNLKKIRSLKALCRSYAKEKQYWLDKLKEWNFQALLGNPRAIRDAFVGKKYTSLYGLQARHWKLALQDAVETWDKYWQAIFVNVKPKIHQKYESEVERHYAYWLLKGYSQFADLMKGNNPEPTFKIEQSLRKQIASYIRRTVKKFKGRAPKVKKARIVKFDANCYEVFKHKNRQYIKLMTLERGKRIVIPLMGITKIEGNLTIVFDKDLDIHVSQELQPLTHSGETLEAVDFGYTEVMTDTQGNAYGKQLGNILTKATNKRHEKMQKRHKLHSLEKKYRTTAPFKAKNIKKYNLGRQKLDNKTKRVQQALKCEINEAINQLIKKINPAVLVTENLRHNFTYNKTKKVNRYFSAWMRGQIQDRVEFKALAKGFRHEQVNPAYGSQTCPKCEFVDCKNRSRDNFKCLFCGHEDMADRVAATNYKRRYCDREIGLHMPCDRIKTILLNRFHRRLEAGQPATVPGKTLDTVAEVHPPPSRDKNVVAGREEILVHRTVNQRAKQK